MFEQLKEKFNGLPMWAKIGLGVVVIGGVIFGAIKIFKRKNYRK